MNSDISSGLEAHKLINISLGKMAASRTGRTGASLHKSLLVATVLHKARFVYLEEAQNYHNAIFFAPEDNAQSHEYTPEPPRAPTPLPEVTVTPVHVLTDLDAPGHDESIENEECLSEEGFSDPDGASKKRRRINEVETELAVTSILPKRLKSEDVDDFSHFAYSNDSPCPCDLAEAPCVCPDSQTSDICNMEVDNLTSLVSIFSFNQQQTDLCSSQAHHPPDVGPHVLALTAA